MITDGKIDYLCIQFRNVVELTLINIETTHKGDHPLDSQRECFMSHGNTSITFSSLVVITILFINHVVCGEFQFLTLLVINNINIVLETLIILKCFPVFLIKDLIVKDHCF